MRLFARDRSTVTPSPSRLRLVAAAPTKQEDDTQAQDNERYAAELDPCPECGSAMDGDVCACGYSVTAAGPGSYTKPKKKGRIVIGEPIDTLIHIGTAVTTQKPKRKSAAVTAGVAEDGDVLPQLFTVRQNEGGRFEVLNPEGTKVAETIEHDDAQDICDMRNGVTVEPVLAADDDPFVEEMVAAMMEPIEDPGFVSATIYTPAIIDQEMEALVAAIPVNPPAEWFFMDEPDEPTPMTVTSDGQVYGHAAIWGTCHLGNPRGAGVCVQPPVSQTDYGLFHLGELQADGGDRVAVGQITLDTGHAPMGASARTAAAHYDDTGAVVADVRAKNGVHGIWYSGALRPDVTPSQVRKLTASKISGDWRGGELVGMLCVNVPGFPVPRTQARLVATAGGIEEVMALVAAGIVGESRTRDDVALDLHILAAVAEGVDPVDALVALAEA